MARARSIPRAQPYTKDTPLMWFTVDWLIDKLLRALPTILYKLFVSYSVFRKKTAPKHIGQILISRVNHQGVMTSILSGDAPTANVSQLPHLLHQLLKETVDKRFLANPSNYAGYSICEFRINSTRISTFFAFTDGERILLHDREASDPSTQIIAHDKYDAFGAVTFENATLQIKIGNQKGFFASVPLKIEMIPGIAFEDTSEVNGHNLFFPRTTVIMIGFMILLARADLDKAISINGKSVVELYPIDQTPDPAKLTSKATLAINHIRRLRQSA